MPAPDNSTNPDANNTNQSGGMTFSSLVFWESFSGIAVVVLTVLASIAGLGTWYFSSRVNAVKDVAFDRFKTESATDIASANRIAEEARLDTAKALKEVALAKVRGDNLELNLGAQRQQTAKLEKEAALAKKELLEVQEMVGEYASFIN